MTKEWDGRPSNPEVSGYHWLRWNVGLTNPELPDVPARWWPGTEIWTWSDDAYAPIEASQRWVYLGPVAPYQDATADAGGQAAPHPDVAQAVAAVEAETKDGEPIDLQKVIFATCERSNGGCACKAQGTNLSRGAPSSLCEMRYSVGLSVLVALVNADRRVAEKAVADERERCLLIVDTEEELDGDPPFEMSKQSQLVARAIVRATKKSIAKRLCDGHPPTPRPGASVGALRALSEALRNLEKANDALAATRAKSVYDLMLKTGQQEQIEALDVARRNARAALAQSDPARTPEGAPPRDGGPSR